MNENETYIDTIDEIENRIADGAKYPVVEDGRINMFLKMCFEIIKILINYLVYNNATKKNSE